MSTEPKPFASLSSGLLARKGAARPAMRPQGFGQMGASLEDLGWDDMGFEPPKPAATPAPDAEHDAFGEVVPAHPHKLAGLTPVDSPVHNQQAQIAGRLKAASPQDAEEDEIDDTAELYDPECEADTAQAAGLVPEAKPVQVLMTKPVRKPVEPVVEPVAKKPVEPAPVQKAAPVPVLRRRDKVRAAPASKAKAAFTLRLEPERHLKLRLACAVTGRSAQMLVTDVLDEFLASMPELDAMADKAKRKG
ncbi:MAG TPA: hypothetical protein VMK31_05655 [Sphingomicrobium sp.]|nr:hypothetical protein [Sphingomicrobium sp.]